MAVRQDVDGSLPEARVRGSRGLSDEVFERLPHGIAVTDRVGAVLGWNQAFEEVLALDANVEGKTVPALGCGMPWGPEGAA